MVLNIYNPSLRLLCKFAFNRLPAKVATLCLYGQNRLYNIFYSHLSIAHSLAETFRHLFSIIANFFFPLLPNTLSNPTEFPQHRHVYVYHVYVYFRNIHRPDIAVYIYTYMAYANIIYVVSTTRNNKNFCFYSVKWCCCCLFN